MKTCRIGIYCQKWESGGIEAFLHNMLTHMDRIMPVTDADAMAQLAQMAMERRKS